MPGYPSTATLVAMSTVDELTSLTSPQQDAAREVAIRAVERYTGQRFEPSTDDVVIDGSGSTEVYTPVRVEELTAITVKGTDIDLTDVIVGEKGDRIWFAPLSTSYAVQAMRERAWDSRTFRAGTGMVVLSGSFGWSVTPAAVVQALRIEMEQEALANASALSGIVASARRLGLMNLSQGNLRAQIGEPSLISPAAAALLSGYIWLGAGGYKA